MRCIGLDITATLKLPSRLNTTEPLRAGVEPWA